MIELFALIFALAGIHETARRRGVPGWPFVVVGAVGWLLAGVLAAAAFGKGLHFFFSWGWVALTYFSTFIIGGGGHQLSSTWQCPDCRAFNTPSTLVCLCGHDPAKQGQPAPE